MRPRKKDRHLPACMYQRGPSYYHVKNGKWVNLGKDYPAALLQYAKITNSDAVGGMAGLIDETLRHIEPTKAKNTMVQYRVAAARLKGMLAEFEPNQVLPRHVAAIKIHLSSTPAMANRILSFLKVVFSYGLEKGVVDSNPCTGVKRHAEARRGRYITDEEFHRLLQHCSDYMRVIFEMCYLTGQRIGDVLAIRLADISEEGISFVQQKTSAKLLVRMTPDIEDVIRRAKALPRRVRGLTLFCARSGGKPVSYETCKEAFAIAREQAGLVDVRIHDLRAKSLTDTKRQGNDAQKLGGHSDARMTARYIRDREIDRADPPAMPKKSG